MSLNDEVCITTMFGGCQVKNSLLTLYAVRNSEGKYLRTRGVDSHFCSKGGELWVDSLTKAKIYTKPGPARARVTFFANAFPQYGIPELVELHVTEVVAIQETDRVQKSQKDKNNRLARYEKWADECKRKAAEKKLEEAKAELDRLDRLPQGAIR